MLLASLEMETEAEELEWRWLVRVEEPFFNRLRKWQQTAVHFFGELGVLLKSYTALSCFYIRKDWIPRANWAQGTCPLSFWNGRRLRQWNLLHSRQLGKDSRPDDYDSGPLWSNQLRLKNLTYLWEWSFGSLLLAAEISLPKPSPDPLLQISWQTGSHPHRGLLLPDATSVVNLFKCLCAV